MAPETPKLITPPDTSRSSPFAAIAPSMLIGVRITLGPVLLAGALYHWPGLWLTVVIAAGFFSDVFDGIIARKLGVATEHLRVADSWADALFYGCAAAAIWLTHRSMLTVLAVPICLALGFMLLSAAVDVSKFKRVSSYHTYAAKLWGVTLLWAIVSILGFNGGVGALWPAIVICIYSSIEGLAITFVLPDWTHDVPHVFKAIELRKLTK